MEGIKRKLDNVGRIVLPIEYRNELGVKNEEEVEITYENRAIVIRKPNSIDIKKYIEEKQLDENISTETYRVLSDILEKMN